MKKHSTTIFRWGVLWHSKNKLDGVNEYLMCNSTGVINFHTRREARLFIEMSYSYIRTRKDLRAEPHGWRMPKAVKIKITAKVI